MKCFVEITSNVRLLSNFGAGLTLRTNNNNSAVIASLLFLLLRYSLDSQCGQLMYLWRSVLLESSNVSASTSNSFLLNPDTRPPTGPRQRWSALDTALVLQFWIHCTEPLPLCTHGDCVERVKNFQFLGTHISDQQRFLRLLKRNSLNEPLCTALQPGCGTGCSAADIKALQRVVNTAQKISGCPLPSLEEIANTRYLSRATAVTRDRIHPGCHLFDLLPSGKPYRSFKTRTNRLKHS